MQVKRSVVWLSATPQRFSAAPLIGAEWQIHLLDLNRPPSRLTKQFPPARIGVLDLSGYSHRDKLYIDEWIDTLKLRFWVCVLAGPLSGNGEDKYLASVISKYCSDYHTAPIDARRMNTVLGHLWGMAELLTTTPPTVGDGYLSIALEGQSPAIRDTKSLMHKFAHTPEPVLIQGESGSGKEAAARFIHEKSARRDQPLITVNCAAIPVSLTQSELFGHEKGSFTHALTARIGRLELANGGTLLFAGIDELKQEQQSAILRFLQEGQIERIGAAEPKSVDARIVATSTQPLETMVDNGSFRSDVFYRISGLDVRMPPLRERIEDIPVLSEHLLAGLHPVREKKRISKQSYLCMALHRWPGNLRELQNRLRQAVLLCDGAMINPEDLGLNQSPSPEHEPGRLTLEEARSRAEQQAISCSLALANHNISAAARILKISRVSLYRLMEKYASASHTAAEDRPFRDGR